MIIRPTQSVLAWSLCVRSLFYFLHESIIKLLIAQQQPLTHMRMMLYRFRRLRMDIRFIPTPLVFHSFHMQDTVYHGSESALAALKFRYIPGFHSEQQYIYRPNIISILDHFGPNWAHIQSYHKIKMIPSVTTKDHK